MNREQLTTVCYTMFMGHHKPISESPGWPHCVFLAYDCRAPVDSIASAM